jgi:hypothetical protein
MGSGVGSGVGVMGAASWLVGLEVGLGSGVGITSTVSVGWRNSTASLVETGVSSILFPTQEANMIQRIPIIALVSIRQIIQVYSPEMKIFGLPEQS